MPAAFITARSVGQVIFQPLAVGEPWGTSWGTTWMRVEGQLPETLPEGRAIELVFNLGWLEWPVGGHIEGHGIPCRWHRHQGTSPAQSLDAACLR